MRTKKLKFIVSCFSVGLLVCGTVVFAYHLSGLNNKNIIENTKHHNISDSSTKVLPVKKLSSIKISTNRVDKIKSVKVESKPVIRKIVNKDAVVVKENIKPKSTYIKDTYGKVDGKYVKFDTTHNYGNGNVVSQHNSKGDTNFDVSDIKIKNHNFVYNINTEELSYEVARDINQYRVSSGLPALHYNSTLNMYAKQKSDNMIEEDSDSHWNKQGFCECQYLARHHILGGKLYGENTLLWDSSNQMASAYDINSQEGLAKVIANEWWNSPAHRANIINPTFKNFGVQVVMAHTDYKSPAVSATTEFEG